MSLLDKVGATFAKLGTKGLTASAVLSRSTPGLLDAATGAPTTATITTTTTSVVLDGASLRTLGYRFGESMVQGGDLMALMPAYGLTFNPQPGDTITVGSAIYRVIDVQPTFAGSVQVLFNCLVRV